MVATSHHLCSCMLVAQLLIVSGKVLVHVAIYQMYELDLKLAVLILLSFNMISNAGKVLITSTDFEMSILYTATGVRRRCRRAFAPTRISNRTLSYERFSRRMLFFLVSSW